MSRITTEAVCCAVCGQTSSQMTLVSAYVQGTGLDGKPLGALPRVQECPHCHYAAPRLDAPAPPAVAEMVRSPAYQRWWTAQPDAPLRRVEAAARLATAGEPLPAADLQLLAAWYAEDAGDAQKAAGHRQAAGRARLYPDHLPAGGGIPGKAVRAGGPRFRPCGL